MPYTITQDGTQAFGISDCPITINGVEYIAEELSFTGDSRVEVIRDCDGVPNGQVIIPENYTGSGRLQLATASTPIPPRGMQFTMQGAQWYITSTGLEQRQGTYRFVPISFTQKLAV